ncbi:MAG: hypothetical protein B6241_09610 [Spirochaetaceae bacterium 4572_59]|nr:MAG: hypothetical protein B6241_09610 [Spirochaetaceae bacterium 4572_59]
MCYMILQFKKTFRKSLFFNILFIAVLPLLCFGYLSINLVSRNMEQDISSRNTLLALTIGTGIERSLVETGLNLSYLLEILDRNTGLGEEGVRELILPFLKNYPLIDHLEFMDQNGLAFRSFPGLENKSIPNNSHYSFFRVPRIEQRPYWSAVFQSPVSDSSALVLSLPYQKGVVAAYIDLTELEKLLDHVSMNYTGFIVVSDQEGNIIAWNEKSMTLERDKLIQHEIMQYGLGGVQKTMRYRDSDEEYFGSSYILKNVQWVIAVVQPAAEAFHSISKMRTILLFGIFSVAILAIILVVLILSKILIPLKRISGYAKQITAGDYDFHFQKESYEELNKLTGAFNTMATAILNREESLFISEKRLRTLLDNLTQCVFYKNQNFEYSICNESFLRDLGMEQEMVLGKTDYDLFDLKTADQKRALDEYILRTGKVLEFDDTNCVEGRTYTKHIIKSPVRDEKDDFIGVLGMYTDITERLKLEEQLWNLQKIEALGQLAGGIAHDFNNIMTGVFGYVELAEMNLADDHPASLLLKKAKVNMDRATSLSGKLLTFAKGGEPLLGDVSLEYLLKEVIVFDLSGSSVNLEYQNDTDLWTAVIDKVQIQQVFSNLTINAVQAMPNGGTLSVSVQNFDNSRGGMKKLESGKFLHVLFRDNGPGIPNDLQQKVFDPYFTTKSKGNGLGLATVFSIVKRHHGLITLSSKPGQGTEFSLFLPAKDQAIHKKVERKIPPDFRDHTFSRILVVDNEKTILILLEYILKSGGYQVDTADNGRDAVALYGEAMAQSMGYDAVILDLTIPGGAGGVEILKNLLTLDPGIKAIVSSGYAEDPVLANYDKYGFKGIVKKPYTAEKLLSVVASVLKS